MREALRTLASKGLVTNVPHGGACVSALEGDESIELMETRSLLEPEATVATVRMIAAETVRNLWVLLERLLTAADGSSSVEYGRLNREFHRTILAHCPNGTLAKLIDSLWDRAERGRAVCRMFDGHVETSMAQHEQIVRCIAERNEAALRAIFVEHFAHVLAAVHRFVEMDRRASAEGVGEVAAAAATPKRTARIAS